MSVDVSKDAVHDVDVEELAARRGVEALAENQQHLVAAVFDDRNHRRAPRRRIDPDADLAGLVGQFEGGGGVVDFGGDLDAVSSRSGAVGRKDQSDDPKGRGRTAQCHVGEL